MSQYCFLHKLIVASSMITAPMFGSQVVFIAKQEEKGFLLTTQSDFGRAEKKILCQIA